MKLLNSTPPLTCRRINVAEWRMLTEPEWAVRHGPLEPSAEQWLDQIIRVACEVDHLSAEEDRAVQTSELRRHLLQIVLNPPSVVGEHARD